MLRRVDWVFGVRELYSRFDRGRNPEADFNRLEEITARSILRLKPVEAGVIYMRRYGQIMLHPGYAPTGILINGLF